MLNALGILAVIVLIAANGYFVAGEFAFVAARRSKFSETAGSDRKSRRALDVHKRLSFMLSGAQLGITVTTLVLGFIAEPAIAGLIEPALTSVGLPDSVSFGVAFALSFVLATTAQMVFGELAPKNLAIAKPEPVARTLAPSMWLYMRFSSPLIRLFDGAANRLLRLVGVEPVEELHNYVNAQELDLIVDSSAESGHLTEVQAALLERAINFSELEASDAMVPWNRVITIGIDETAEDLRTLMDSNHSRFPVVDADGKPEGVVHAKDLLSVPRGTYAQVLVGELLHEVLAVPEAAGLSIVLAELRARSTEMAIVIDEYGAPAGVVTLEDIVEELVGAIEDEYDPAHPGDYVQIEPGIWLIDASSRTDEIERVTGFDLPEGEYDTVAGLVLDRLERIPEVGDHVVVKGVRIEVLAVEDFTIQQLRLCLIDIDTADDGADADGTEPTRAEKKSQDKIDKNDRKNADKRAERNADKGAETTP